MENYHQTKEQQFAHEDRAILRAMDREREKRPDKWEFEKTQTENRSALLYNGNKVAIIEHYTPGNKNLENSIIAGLGDRDKILNLELQNSILLNALKEIAVPYREELTHKQDNTLVKYFVAIAQKALMDIGIDTEIQKQKIDIDSLIDKSKNLTK